MTNNIAHQIPATVEVLERTAAGSLAMIRLIEHGRERSRVALVSIGADTGRLSPIELPASVPLPPTVREHTVVPLRLDKTVAYRLGSDFDVVVLEGAIDDEECLSIDCVRAADLVARSSPDEETLMRVMRGGGYAGGRLPPLLLSFHGREGFVRIFAREHFTDGVSVAMMQKSTMSDRWKRRCLANTSTEIVKADEALAAFRWRFRSRDAARDYVSTLMRICKSIEKRGYEDTAQLVALKIETRAEKAARRLAEDRVRRDGLTDVEHSKAVDAMAEVINESMATGFDASRREPLAAFLRTVVRNVVVDGRRTGGQYAVVNSAGSRVYVPAGDRVRLPLAAAATKITAGARAIVAAVVGGRDAKSGRSVVIQPTYSLTLQDGNWYYGRQRRDRVRIDAEASTSVELHVFAQIQEGELREDVQAPIVCVGSALDVDLEGLALTSRQYEFMRLRAEGLSLDVIAAVMWPDVADERRRKRRLGTLVKQLKVRLADYLLKGTTNHE